MTTAAAKAVAMPRVVLEAERAVLGCLLIDAAGGRAAFDRLKTVDFYLDRHRLLFEAAVAVYKRDGAVDVVTACAELRRLGKLAALGDEASSGAQYVMGCTAVVATTAHAEYYAQLVREASLDRQVGAQLTRTAADKTPENVQALRELMDALHGVRHDRMFRLQDDLPAALDELAKAKGPSLDLGFPALDHILGGVEPGHILTVGARPGGGKTAFMTKACLQLAEHAKVPCLYITTEMTELEMVERILPAASGVPAWKFRRRRLSPEDIGLVSTACGERLSRLPVTIYGKPVVSMADIRRAAAQAKPRVIFIDYLQRCAFPAGDSRTYQIMEFLVQLKTFAQESRLAVVLACQLDRKLDKTKGLEPELADLKDSGAIEAESSQVVLLWRPAPSELKYKPAPVASGPDFYHIRAKVAKNRRGSANKDADFFLHGPFVDFLEAVKPDGGQEEML